MGTAQKEVLVFGAGSYCMTVLELAEACGARVRMVIDDDPGTWGTTVGGISVTSREQAIADGLVGRSVALALGSADARQEAGEWVRAAGGQLRTLIHPKAVVSPSAVVGAGCLIHPGAMVWTAVTLGSGVYVSPGAGVAHHASVGDFCTVSMGALVGAGTTVGDRVLIGMGATVKTGVRTVGSSSVVGAGAVVVRDVPPSRVWPVCLLELFRTQPRSLSSRKIAGHYLDQECEVFG